MFIIILITLIKSQTFGSDAYPICERQSNVWYCVWTLTEDQVSTGDSNTAVQIGAINGVKTLEFKIAGTGTPETVDMVVVAKEGENAASVKTYTFDTAGIYRYAITHPISKLYFTSTITAGKISIYLEGIMQ